MIELSDQNEVIIDLDNNSKNIEVMLLEESVKSLIGAIPYSILTILKEGEKFSKEIREEIEKIYSKEFTEQTIYYHLRKLIERGFIGTINVKIEINDRIINIQKYHLIARKFIIQFENNLEDHSSEVIKLSLLQNNTEKFQELILNRPKIFQSFESDSKFNGHLVIGSRSNDSPYIGPVSFLLGKYFKFPEQLFVNWDTKIVEDHLFDENLILLGGPFVNNIFLLKNESQKSLNDMLPVEFLQTKDSGLRIHSDGRIILSKDKNIGVIQFITNPWNPEKVMLIIGGPKKIGTEAAVIALTKKFFVVENYLLTQQYCLIEAILENGKIIDVEIIE